MPEQRKIHREVPYDEVKAAGYEMDILGPGPFVAYMESRARFHGDAEEHEVWRFPEKRLVCWLADRMGDAHDYHWMQRREPTRERGCADMNTMAVAYAEGEFSLDEYMQFYRDMGYSLCGFIEIFGDKWDEAHGIKRCQKPYSEDEDGTPLEVCGEPEDAPIHTENYLNTGKPEHKFQAEAEDE